MYDDEFLASIETGLASELRHFDLAPETGVRLLTISENATFVATHPGGDPVMVLRVHRPDYHSEAEIAAELAWIDALRQEGIVDTPRPVPRRDGTLVGAFDCAGQTRHVVAFEFMSGREPDPADDLTPWFFRLGALHARLHDHARRWQRPQTFVRKTWNHDTTVGAIPHWGDWRAGLGLDAAGGAVLARTVAALREKLDRYGCDRSRFGLVHADLRLANILVEGDRLGVIDFDDCGFGWYLYDFAAAISFHEHEPFVPALQAAWVEGYRTIASLSGEDEAMLPVFVMLRRILLTAWIASHAETPTAIACGTPYTHGTVQLADAFLKRHG